MLLCVHNKVCAQPAHLWFSSHKHVKGSPWSSSVDLSLHNKPSTQGTEGPVVGVTYK